MIQRRRYNGRERMKQNSDYCLAYLAGVPYLLPFGQMIAGHRRSIRINETGAAVWKLLKTPLELAELTEQLSRLFQIPAEEREVFENDIETFLSQLIGLGIIEDSPAVPEESPVYLKIAGLVLKLCVPTDAVSDDFRSFLISTETFFSDGGFPDQVVRISRNTPPAAENGFYLLRDSQLIVYEMREHYLLQFPAFLQITSALLAKDGSSAVFYCPEDSGSSIQDEFFHAIRITFLYLAGLKQMYAIHSASVGYQDRAWLFSGQSGTGKSTHAGLWNKYVSAPVLNGDINLAAFDNGVPVIHGIPWCGTSGICEPHTRILGGIVLLKQERSDYLISLSDDEKLLFVLQRLISPLWTEEMLEHALAFVRRLTGKSAVFRLGCTVSENAVATIRNAIDELQQPFSG